MRVLILSQYFHPEFAIIPNELAFKLQEKGHSVKVLTGFPNYPTGQIFPGYKQKFRSREYYKHIEILRVPYFINRSRNSVLRILSYLSFGYSAFSAFKFADDCDVIYVYATQMTAAIPAGLQRNNRRKIPYVLHIQDLWPESVTESGLINHGLITKAINSLLIPWINSLYEKSSKLIAIAPSMKQMLFQRGVPSEKIETVMNWADESAMLDSKTDKELKYIFNLSRGELKIVYAGNLGEMQNLDTLLTAVSRVSNKAAFHLFIVGTGTKEEELKEQAAKLALSNVTFVGRVDPIYMAQIYKESDFQVISLKELEIFKGTIPSKFQAALQFGIPVISIVEGDVNRIVEENQLGFTALANDEQSIVDAFDRALNTNDSLRNSLSRNAINYYKAHMSANNGISKIESILIEAFQNQGGNKIV